MAYLPTNSQELAFSTTALLTNGQTFSSGVLDLRDWSQVQTDVVSDVDGTINITFYTDAGGADAARSLAIPYVGGSGFKMFSAPAFTQYVKYEFTANEVGQADFSFDTKFLKQALSAQLLGVEDFISPSMSSSLGRNVQVGKNPDGTYTNQPAAGVDSANSTNTPLGIGGVFTGAWTKVDQYAEIKASYNSDVPAGSVLLQLSHDGALIGTSLSLPPQLVGGAYKAIHSLNPSLPYFRVIYTNGSVAQTSFGLTVSLLANSGGGFISRATQVLDRYSDVTNQRVINSPDLDRNLGLINYQEAHRAFGVNEAVVNTVFEDVWSQGALYPILTAAETLRVAAGGNANDTAAGTGARTISIEGLDAGFNRITETVTLNGALASVATTQSFLRVNYVEVLTVGTAGTSNVGIISIEGVTSSSIIGAIPIGLGSSKAAIYTVPTGFAAYITAIKVSVGLGDSSDVRLWVVKPNGVKDYELSLEDFSGFSDVNLRTFLKFDAETTIGFDAKRITGSGSARVSVDYDFTLIAL